jgi:endonuclease YncB( thermonuclease family)
MYVGSKNSDVYHYPSCQYVDNILPENKIWFSSAQDAINHGYRPCKVCKPPSTSTVPTEPEPVPEPVTEPEAPSQDIITVHVVNVVDGDTFDTSEGYTIRLADVDAPELGENGYLDSTEYLEYLIEDKTVILDIDSVTGTDPYGRYVCLVYVEYNSTHCLNVNQALVYGNFAVIDNYSNNEFEPSTWTLYSQTEIIPEFPSWIIFPIFVSITLYATCIRKKSN